LYISLKKKSNRFKVAAAILLFHNEIKDYNNKNNIIHNQKYNLKVINYKISHSTIYHEKKSFEIKMQKTINISGIFE